MSYVNAYIKSFQRALMVFGAVNLIATALELRAISLYLVYISLFVGFGGPTGLFLAKREK